MSGPGGLSRRGLLAGGVAAGLWAGSAPARAECPQGVEPVGLFSEIGALRIPARTDSIFTSGRTEVGRYPAHYVRDPDQSELTAAGAALLRQSTHPDRQRALAALLGRIRARDADGVWWVLETTTQPVHAGHFGAIPDGRYDYGSGAMAGTDSRAAIQAAIDYLTRIRRDEGAVVRIPPGTFRLSGPLQLGYAVSTVVLQGEWPVYEQGHGGGTMLLCDFDDQPGIAITGARRSAIRNLHVLGRSRHWIETAGGVRGETFAQQQKPRLDDLQMANWFDPGRPARDPRLRHCPYAGVAVDPWNGAAPGAAAGVDRYPELDMPAWLPDAERVTYGRTTGSSRPALERVRISGFAVGFVNQPGDFDANGDFVQMTDVMISHCGVAVSIGNTQHRDFSARKLEISACHTGITTSMHGRRNGRLDGVLDDLALGSVIEVFRLDNGSTIWGPVIVNSLFGENVWSLGTVSFSGADPAPLVLNGPKMSFTLHSDAPGGRGVPRYLLADRRTIGMPAYGHGRAVFRDFSFGNFPTVLPVLVDAFFDSGWATGNYALHGHDSRLWRRNAANTLAGGLVPAQMNPGSHPHRITHPVANITDPGAPVVHVASEPMADYTSRDYPASIWCQSLSPGRAPRREAIANYVRSGHAAEKSNFIESTFDAAAGIWRFAVSFDADECDLAGYAPGGVLIDSDGFVFWVERRSGAPGAWRIEAQLQNGFRVEAGGAGRSYPEGAFSPESGPVYGHPGRFFTPPQPTRFTAQPSSPALALEGGSSEALRPGDALFLDLDRGGWPGTGALLNRVVAVPGPDRIVVETPATGAAEGRRIELVQRKAP